MKKTLLILVLLAASFSKADSTTNSIDALVARLDSSALWQNGLAPIVELSSNATPYEVVTAAVSKSRLTPDPVRKFRITESRAVTLRGWRGYAALVDFEPGKKILLFRYEPGGGRSLWWTRFFDVPQEAEPIAPANGASPRR